MLKCIRCVCMSGVVLRLNGLVLLVVVMVFVCVMCCVFGNVLRLVLCYG